MDKFFPMRPDVFLQDQSNPIDEKLALLDLANQDAIDYGRYKLQELILANLYGIGAILNSLSFDSNKITVYFTLEKKDYVRSYEIY